MLYLEMPQYCIQFIIESNLKVNAIILYLKIPQCCIQSIVESNLKVNAIMLYTAVLRSNFSIEMKACKRNTIVC